MFNDNNKKASTKKILLLGAKMQRSLPCIFHKNYYSRNASTDGKSIVYHSGADIYVYNVSINKSNQIHIQYNSSFTKKTRKFDSAFHYLENITIDSKLKIHLKGFT